MYEGKKSYVFTKKEYEDNEKVEFTSESIVEFVPDIKSGLGKDIRLVGGGKLIHEFINKNLIDRSHSHTRDFSRELEWPAP